MYLLTTHIHVYIINIHSYIYIYYIHIQQLMIFVEIQSSIILKSVSHTNTYIHPVYHRIIMEIIHPHTHFIHNIHNTHLHSDLLQI